MRSAKFHPQTGHAGGGAGSPPAEAGQWIGNRAFGRDVGHLELAEDAGLAADRDDGASR
jgi:hypothetical protein